jgi:putative sigma-54 modulation protein
MTSDAVLFHTEGFTARDELLALAHRKVEKLFRHGDRPVRVRLNLARETPHSGADRFAATARLERAGRDDVTHAFGETPDAVVHEVIDKLERMINARAEARKHADHHPHAVELPADLPKA